MKYLLIFFSLIYSYLFAQIDNAYNFSKYFENETQILIEFPNLSKQQLNLLEKVYQQNYYTPIWNTRSKVVGLENWTRKAKKIGKDISKIKPYQINEKLINLDLEYFKYDIQQTLNYIELYALFLNGTIPEKSRGKTIHLPAFSLDTFNIVMQIADSDNFSIFEEVIPKVKIFHDLFNTTQYYYEIVECGDWPKVNPKVDSLKIGDRDFSISNLKKRLFLSKDYPIKIKHRSPIFDKDLSIALKHFQERMGIDSTGILDSTTLYHINISAKQRWEQLALNVERWLWLPKDFGIDYFYVNIPSLNLELYHIDSLVSSHRAVIGRIDRQTPIFYAPMSYVEFNPTWTIPPNILANDIVPASRKNPSYLSKKGIKVFDKNGVVDFINIDWKNYKKYSFVQEPGPSNALGSVKFIFPNKYFIFFHDTPNKSHFALTDRAYSSGCIRIENPIELAYVLLNYSKLYTREKIDEILKSRKQTRVNLVNPPKVFITYFTASANKDYQVKFYKDVYNLDLELSQLLFTRR